MALREMWIAGEGIGGNAPDLSFGQDDITTLGVGPPESTGVQSGVDTIPQQSLEIQEVWILYTSYFFEI